MYASHAFDLLSSFLKNNYKIIFVFYATWLAMQHVSDVKINKKSW